MTPVQGRKYCMKTTGAPHVKRNNESGASIILHPKLTKQRAMKKSFLRSNKGSLANGSMCKKILQKLQY